MYEYCIHGKARLSQRSWFQAEAGVGGGLRTNGERLETICCSLVVFSPNSIPVPGMETHIPVLFLDLNGNRAPPPPPSLSLSLLPSPHHLSPTFSRRLSPVLPNGTAGRGTGRSAGRRGRRRVLRPSHRQTL